MDKSEVGRTGERLAGEFLRRKGHTILETNYRQSFGEIDVISRRGAAIHFVEVKTVTRENYSDISREKIDYKPEELIHPDKLRKIQRVAEYFISRLKEREELDFQVDAVCLLISPVHRKAVCRYYEQIL